VSAIKNVTLSDFCATGSGGTPSRSKLERYYQGGTIPWVKSGELRESIINRAEEYVTDAALKESSIKLVPAGAILLAMYGATVGRLGILGIEATTNQAVCHIVPDPKVALTRYVYHALSSQVPNLISMGVGGAQPNINQGIIKNLAIPLPPLPEQRRIAAILDQADALRAKRREAYAQLDSLTQSIFIEMFGDLTKYPIASLADMCELITDGTHQTPTYADAGTIFLSAKNVTSGYIDWERIKYIPESLHQELHRRLSPKVNDILLAKNGTTGVAAIVDRSCTFDIYVSLALLRPKHGVVPGYLLGAINSPICKKQFNESLKGIGVPNLHLKEIRDTQIPVPPIHVQEDFARAMTAVERQKSACIKASSELDRLFASLQHRAFRGEL
jgi:type I restriction enzyme S subunit